jgi:hypothetical protein
MPRQSFLQQPSETIAKILVLKRDASVYLSFQRSSLDRLRGRGASDDPSPRGSREWMIIVTSFSIVNTD